MRNLKFKTNILVLVVIISLFIVPSVFAMTPAGTVIENQAQVSYEDANGNQKATVNSNIVTITVKQVAGVDISPLTASKNTPDNSIVYYDFTVTNTGNGEDSYSISTSGLPAEWSSVIFIDENDNGIYDEGTDTEVTNTGNLNYNSTIDLIAEVTIPEGAVDQSSETLDISFTSDYDNNVSEVASYTTTVTDAVLDIQKTSSPASPLPGDEVTYDITITNEGTGTAQNVVMVDQLPAGVSYVAESMVLTYMPGDTAESVTNLTDSDDADEGDYNIINPSAITLAIDELEGGKEYQLSFKVLVDSDLEAGTSIGNSVTLNYEDENGLEQSEETSNTSTINISQEAGVEFNIEDDSFDVTPGDQLVVPVEITNTGNGVDTFDGSYTSNYLNWEFYCDNDGDGVLNTDIDTLCVDTDGDGYPDTGEVQPGETVQILGVTDVPEDSDDLSSDTLSFTATSSYDTNISTTGDVTTTVHAPEISVQKSVTPTGEQAPGTVLTYTITVTNNGSGSAQNVNIYDTIPDNTDYVSNSTYVDGNLKSDSNVLFGNTIEVSISQLTPNDGSVTVEFDVEIN